LDIFVFESKNVSKYHKCEQKNLPETRYECKDRSFIEENKVVSLKKKTHHVKTNIHSSLHPEFKNMFFLVKTIDLWNAMTIRRGCVMFYIFSVVNKVSHRRFYFSDTTNTIRVHYAIHCYMQYA